MGWSLVGNFFTLFNIAYVLARCVGVDRASDLFVIKRPRIRLPAGHCCAKPHASYSLLCASVTKQYNAVVKVGRKVTPFPHLQFMTQSVPPPQIVIMLAHDHCQGPKHECNVPPPLILHFNHWVLSWGRWCPAAGKVIAGLAESNSSLAPGLSSTSPADWLPIDRDKQLRAPCSIYDYWTSLSRDGIALIYTKSK